MSQPKRHHYLPQFYMRRFSKNGEVWVYDRKLRKLRRDQVRNVAVRKHYYSLEDRDGNLDAGMENDFSIFESRAKLVLDKLEEGVSISTEERFWLSQFLALQHVRTPSYERSMNEIISGFMEAVLRKNLEDPKTAANFETDPGALLASLNAGPPSIKANNNMRMQEILSQLQQLGKAFFVQDWIVASSHIKVDFLTCDDPFGIVVPETMPAEIRERPWGVASPETFTVFPMSPRSCLLMRGDGGGSFYGATVTKAYAENLNREVVGRTERFAISAKRKQLGRLAKECGLDRNRLPSKMRVRPDPHPSGDPMRSVLTTWREDSPKKSSSG